MCTMGCVYNEIYAFILHKIYVSRDTLVRVSHSDIIGTYVRSMGHINI